MTVVSSGSVDPGMSICQQRFGFAVSSIQANWRTLPEWRFLPLRLQFLLSLALEKTFSAVELACPF